MAKESFEANFGLLIAYLLPGFVALWGVAYISPVVQTWFGTAPEQAPSVGGFLYVTLASIMVGLTASTVRWLIVDTLHHATGVMRPSWDFSRLGENVAAFDALIEMHYRYYQFYANMVVALVFAMVLRHLAAPGGPWWGDAADAVVVALISVFLAGSRDSLAKYYRRSEQLLFRRQSRVTGCGD